MLIESLEKEWKMTLPDPIPLAIHDSCVSCIQLKDAMVGFKKKKMMMMMGLKKGVGGGGIAMSKKVG